MKLTMIIVAGIVGFAVAKMISDHWALLSAMFRGAAWLVAGVGVVSLILAGVMIFDALKRRRAVNKSADEADIAVNLATQAKALQEQAQANFDAAVSHHRLEWAAAWAAQEFQGAHAELLKLIAMTGVALDQARNGQSIITDTEGRLAAPPVSRITNNYPGQGNDPQLEDGRLKTLVPDLMRFGADDAPQMRLVAPAGTGKSTLLHHFVDEVQANVVLFQTHELIYDEDYAGYGDRVHVVGMSPEYGNANEYDDANEAACKHILRVESIVKSRFQGGTRSPMLLVVDEWYDICDWANENGYETAVKALRMLSTTKARKVGVGIILATQSATAGSQGFKGSADVFKKMIAVELFKTESDRYAKVTRPGAEPLLYDLPGPHPIPVRQAQRKDEQAARMPYKSLADELAEAEAFADDANSARSIDDYQVPDVFLDDANQGLTDDEVKAMDVYQDMIESPGVMSRRQATQAAFGKGKFGDSYNAKLFRLWKSLNLDVMAVEFKSTTHG